MKNSIYATVKKLTYDGFTVEKQVDRFILTRDNVKVYLYFDGYQQWFLNGKLHREGDKPAVIRTDGSQHWYLKNLRHREGDKPAFIGPDGYREWWLNGLCHREGDKPAVIYLDGGQEFWKNGRRYNP